MSLFRTCWRSGGLALCVALAAFVASAPAAIAQLGLEEAQQTASAGDHVDALAAYAEVIAAAPDDPAPHVARARLLSLLSHVDLAIGDLRSAVRLRPDDAGLQNVLCLALALSNHDLDGALAACDAAVRLEPRNYAMLSSRGYLHLRRGEFAKAEKDYSVALNFYPASANEMFGFGVAIIHLGREIEGRGEIASATLDSAGLVSEWEARGFGIRGEVKPGRPVTLASQPLISVTDNKHLLNAGEIALPLASGCARIVTREDEKSAMLAWNGACRFGLLHGEGKLAAAGTDAPTKRFVYGREILGTQGSDALERKLILAYEPVEAAVRR